MASVISLNCMLNVGVVPAASEPRLVYLLIDLRPTPGAEPLQAPVNMAIVLDVSESMRLPVLSHEQFEELKRAGQVTQTTSDNVPVWTFKSIPERIRRNAPSNLEAVQASIAQAASHFQAHDLVSLVAFADSAEVLLRGVPGAEHKRVMDAVQALSSVRVGDETEIGAGLEAGMQELKRAQSSGMVNRALIMTDGFTRDPERVKALAQQARQAGISVSTLGIGVEFNEKLLVDVADASLGNAYFARSPQEIPPAFAQELAAVQAILLRDVEIEIKLSSGVEVRRAHRVRPAISVAADEHKAERAATIDMGDFDPAGPPALLVELIVPSKPGGSFRVAQVAISHAGEGAQREAGPSCDVVLSYAARPGRPEPNPIVMNTVERVNAYVLQTRALDDMMLGNAAAATQKLRAAATRLLTAGEVDLAQAVQAEADRIDESGQLSAESAKELRYATRRLTQKLG